MTAGITGFFHPVITVPDLDEALAFYRDLLGLVVTYTWEHDPGTLARLTGYDDPSARAATLACPDGTEIELVEFRRPRGLDHVEKQWHDAGLSFVTFTCFDLVGLVKRLKEAGVRFVGDIVAHVLEDGAVVKVVYCYAPEGTTITLAELPAGRERLAAPALDRGSAEREVPA
jgi:catechol 2,3-dioxygenase-like lactoylglutathione lyase family enzyme